MSTQDKSLSTAKDSLELAEATQNVIDDEEIRREVDSNDSDEIDAEISRLEEVDTDEEPDDTENPDFEPTSRPN